MKKLLLVFLPVVVCAQQVVSQAKVNVNVQALSSFVLKSKYEVKLPKGMWAGSVVAENLTTGTMFIGQGSIVKALRDAGYPALGRTDAHSIILSYQNRGFGGWISNNLPFAQKLVNDTENLIVAGALKVAPGIGIGIAATSAILTVITPDVVAQISQFEQTYDTDGIQNLLQLGSGQSAIGTIIFDAPPKTTTVQPNSFSLPVSVYQVTGQQPIVVTPARP